MNRPKQINIELTCGKHLWKSSAYFQSVGPKGSTEKVPNDPTCPFCGRPGGKPEDLPKIKSATLKLTKFVNSALGRILVFKN